ncbi:unnamed protein product [Discula destructiva]
MTRLAYPLLDVASRIGITETLTLKPGKEGKRFQTVPVCAPEFYQGPLAPSDPRAVPAMTGGTWFPAAPGGDITSKTVVLYFHGGAYIQGDGRDAQAGPIARKLLAKSGADAVFSLQYRLSGYRGLNPFPAALQDALSAYVFLLHDLKIPATQIVVSGDSAGGNLATALLRYLHDFGSATGLPNPKCAVLFSPWVAPFNYELADNPNRSMDFIPESFPKWGAQTYGGGPGKEAAKNPYITALGNPFPSAVPMFVNAASAELLFDMIVEWSVEMRGVQGNVVELNIEEDAIHDTILVGDLLGFEDSAIHVAARVGEFVRKL